MWWCASSRTSGTGRRSRGDRASLIAHPAEDLHGRRARAADAHLDVLHDAVVERDLHLVALDVPVAHGGQPAPGPAPVWHLAAAPVDERLPARRGEVLALLHLGTADAQHVLVRRLAGHDLGETLAWNDGADVDARRRGTPAAELKSSGQPLVDGLEQIAREHAGAVAEREEQRGDEDGPP